MFSYPLLHTIPLDWCARLFMSLKWHFAVVFVTQKVRATLLKVFHHVWKDLDDRSSLMSVYCECCTDGFSVTVSSKLTADFVGGAGDEDESVTGSWTHNILDSTGTKMTWELKWNSLRCSFISQTITMFTSACVLVRHLSFGLVFFGIARFSSMKTQEVTYESCSCGLRVVATRWRYWRQFVSWYRRWCVEDIVNRHFFVSGSVLFLGLPHRLLIELMKWSLFSIWQWSKERCGIFVKLYKKLFGDAHVQPVEVFDTSNVLKLAVRMLLLDGVLIYHDFCFVL